MGPYAIGPISSRYRSWLVVVAWLIHELIINPIDHHIIIDQALVKQDRISATLHLCTS